MAVNFATYLPLILLDIQQRLMVVTGLPIECVVFSYSGVQPPSFQADRVIEIRVDSSMTEDGIAVGAGRIDTRVWQRCIVVQWTRLEVDVDWQAQAMFTDPILGILYQRHQIFDALCTWHGTGASLTLYAGTVKLGPVGRPNPVGDKVGWAHSEVAIEIPYCLALSQNYQ